jgi:polyisoprenoid-binding protein YceI
MKTFIISKRSFIRRLALISAMGATLLGSTTLYAQTAYQAPGADVKILGSSNLHEWKMKAESAACDAKFTVTGNQLTALNALNFTVQVKKLKSGEGLMDSRAYTALNADKYSTITFSLSTGAVERQANGYLIKANGNLNISGVSRPVTLVANGMVNADKSITITGVQKIKMSEYKIKPPTFMMGMLKVSDDVSVQYSLKFND